MCWVMDWDLWAECVIMIYCRAVFHAILISIGRGARAGLQCHHHHSRHGDHEDHPHYVMTRVLHCSLLCRCPPSAQCPPRLETCVPVPGPARRLVPASPRTRASNEGYPKVPEDFTIPEKAPTWAFCRCHYHKGRAAVRN